MNGTITFTSQNNESLSKLTYKNIKISCHSLPRRYPCH